MANKLELTWIGKNDEVKIEPRLLIENKELSNCRNDENTENMIIHGDNLLALKALESKYAGKIKCIYIDPPYNTGSAFEHYDDNLEHSIWLQLMKYRLQILNNLLQSDGVIFIQIDDEEQAYLKVLCDEVFGRKNFINMVSVNMKNIAGASGGGEDKRLKKNCEFILIYAKEYDVFKAFKPIYKLSPLSELVKEYKETGKSWKYNSVLIDKGEKEYISSTVDGDGNEIKIYKRIGLKSLSIKQFAKENNIDENDVWNLHYDKIFRTTMPQSSIRPRVMEKMKEIGRQEEVISIEYVPKTGKNKGNIYEQFYSGEKYNLFAWLADVAIEKNGKAYKKDLLGTYWDVTSATKNLTKEGDGNEFPNGKKPEILIYNILDMSTDVGDLVLDSFLGSGTTCAVAQKMGRKYIGIEMGEHAYTHCKVRLDKVIEGTDKGGITEEVKWKGGGAYKFYELAPSLIKIDELGNEVIDESYDANMLATAVALHEGYEYSPDEKVYWKQSKSNEKSYLYVTTNIIDKNYIDNIHSNMCDDEFLVIACKNYDKNCKNLYKNIVIKKIPQMILDKCEFSKENYNLNIINPPIYDDEEEQDD